MTLLRKSLHVAPRAVGVTILLVLSLGMVACGSSGSEDTADRSAATFRGTRACIANNRSSVVEVRAFEWKQSEPAEWVAVAASAGEPVQCFAVEGGYFDGGSLVVNIREPGPLDRQGFASMLLLNSLEYTYGEFSNTGICAYVDLNNPLRDGAKEIPDKGESMETTCGTFAVKVTFGGSSSRYQEWEIRIS